MGGAFVDNWSLALPHSDLYMDGVHPCWTQPGAGKWSGAFDTDPTLCHAVMEQALAAASGPRGKQWPAQAARGVPLPSVTDLTPCGGPCPELPLLAPVKPHVVATPPPVRVPVSVSRGTPLPTGGSPQPSEGTMAPMGGSPQPSEGTVAPMGGSPQPSEGTMGGSPQPSAGTMAPMGGSPQPNAMSMAPTGGSPQPSAVSMAPIGNSGNAPTGVLAPRDTEN